MSTPFFRFTDREKLRTRLLYVPLRKPHLAGFFVLFCFALLLLVFRQLRKFCCIPSFG